MVQVNRALGGAVTFGFAVRGTKGGREREGREAEGERTRLSAERVEE